MKQVLNELSIETNGEGFIDITPEINQWIRKNKVQQGLLVISIQHTSCSLTINENADPRVLKDLSSYMKALVPEEGFRSMSGQGEICSYKHKDEGSDDMPAHIRTSLTSSSLSLSINHNKLVLGTWQAIYLWEHRCSRHTRQIFLHAIGELKEGDAGAKHSTDAELIKEGIATNINQVVLQRHEKADLAQEEGADTNLDLLIDRIHDLTNQPN